MTTWTTALHEALLVGSDRPITLDGGLFSFCRAALHAYAGEREAAAAALADALRGDAANPDYRWVALGV